MIKAIKKKKCKHCKSLFSAHNSLVKVCSPQCAKKLLNSAPVKKKPVKPAKIKAKKKKAVSLAKLSEKVAVSLQLLVRIKAADDNGYVSCVTCGVTRHYKDGMQGGHFISRTYKATRLMEENIHTQCQRCNGPKRGMAIEYTIFMTETYGKDFVADLVAMKQQTVKYIRSDLIAMKAGFDQQIRENEKRVID